MSLMGLTAIELGRKIKKKEVSVAEAVEEALEAIEKKETAIHSFLTVDKEGARRRAEQVQRRICKGELTSPLAGVPMAVKDNLCTRGIRTTCASRLLSDFVPTYTAEAVCRLEHAGVIVLGKTNMDEFAMGSTTETSAFGATKNPWDTKHVPGGSSGGSCAAVSAEECSLALGSDTGGSIRQPASFCGVTGLKPTYGTVSRYGLIAYASSLDQIGPIARDVEDCAAMLDEIVSFDKKDATSVKRQACSFREALTEDIKGLRIGIPSNHLSEGLQKEIRQAIFAVSETLKQQGAIVEEFHLDFMDYAVPAYYVIACAEASSNLARFDGVKYGYRTKEYANLEEMYKKTRSEGFGSEAKRRILLGSFVLSSGYYEEYYKKALRTRAWIKQKLDQALERYDAILAPVAPTTAPKLGVFEGNPLKMYQSDIYTVAANLAGLPAISFPCGTDCNGLPIGLQLIGGCFREQELLKAVYAFERTRNYQRSPFAMEGERTEKCHRREYEQSI
ncbi:MAG: Asp-tRNA(Asn)/Glu-tRNA(Gln) amidotransferase subunit GatA [Roseburia sp.]